MCERLIKCVLLQNIFICQPETTWCSKTCKERRARQNQTRSYGKEIRGWQKSHVCSSLISSPLFTVKDVATECTEKDLADISRHKLDWICARQFRGKYVSIWYQQRFQCEYKCKELIHTTQCRKENSLMACHYLIYFNLFL